MEANASKSSILLILLSICLLVEIGDSRVNTLISVPQTPPSQSSFPKTPLSGGGLFPIPKTPPSSGGNPFPFPFPPFSFPFQIPGTTPSSKGNPFPFPFPFPGTPPSTKGNHFPFPLPGIPPSSKGNPFPFPFPFPFPWTAFSVSYFFPFPFPFLGTPFSGGNPFPFPFPFLPLGSPYPFGPGTREAKACLAQLNSIFISSKQKHDLDGTHQLCPIIRELKPKCWPILFPYAPSIPPSLRASCGTPAPAPINPPKPANI